jgi:hypothetical protein
VQWGSGAEMHGEGCPMNNFLPITEESQTVSKQTLNTQIS